MSLGLILETYRVPFAEKNGYVVLFTQPLFFNSNIYYLTLPPYSLPKWRMVIADILENEKKQPKE